MTISKTIHFIVATILAVAFLYLPLLNGVTVYGADIEGGGAGERDISPGGGAGAEPGEVTKLANPIQADNIIEFLEQIIDVLFVFALPIIVIYIMYAGLQFVLARGNPGEIEQARNALLWAIVGGVIILGAKIIITVIAGTIQGF